jgi:hypothetical protein
MQVTIETCDTNGENCRLTCECFEGYMSAPYYGTFVYNPVAHWCGITCDDDPYAVPNIGNPATTCECLPNYRRFDVPGEDYYVPNDDNCYRDCTDVAFSTPYGPFCSDDGEGPYDCHSTDLC